VAAGVSRLVGS